MLEAFGLEAHGEPLGVVRGGLAAATSLAPSEETKTQSFFRPAGRLGPQPQPFAGLGARVGTCFAHSSTTPLERRFTEQDRSFDLFPVEVPVPE